MGNADTKLNFRKAVINLTTKTEPVEADDDTFWEQFWSDSVSSIQVRPSWPKISCSVSLMLILIYLIQDVFALVPSAEIRALREESPSNLATLCYKVYSLALQLLCLQVRKQQCN